MPDGFGLVAAEGDGGGTLGLAAGGAAGYVLEAKAGRQRYQEITESARRFGNGRRSNAPPSRPWPSLIS